MVIQTNLKCELQKAVRVQYLNGNLFSQDNEGNQINVEVFDGGSPASLSGSVSANVIRADGGTVAVSSGSVSGNVASVTLPSAAYAVPGVVSIIIKITSSGVITTLAAIVANVYQSSTDTAVDPGTIIPSIQTLISSIETAVASIPADYSSLWASLAPAFNSNNNYTAGQYVTYNGSVYVFNTNHSGSWSASDVSAVDIGGQISQLKSAFDYTNTGFSVSLGFIPIYPTGMGWIPSKKNVGETVNLNDIRTSDEVYYWKISCSAGDVFTVNAANCTTQQRGWVFTKSDGEVLATAGATANFSNVVITAPENSAYLVMHDFGTHPHYKGKYYNTSSRLDALESNDVDIDGQINSVIEITSNSTVPYPFVVGKTYVITNNSENGISFRTRLSPSSSNVETTTLNAGQTKDFTCGSPADGINIYIASGNIDVVIKRKDALDAKVDDNKNAINTCKSEIDEIELSIDQSLHITSTGTKAYTFKSGSSYLIENNSSGQISFRTMLAGEIAEYFYVSEGKSYVFNCSTSATGAYVYLASGTIDVNVKTIGTVEYRLDENSERIDLLDPDAIPSYFKTMMSTKIPEIRENMNLVGANGDTFVFITDIHWANNAKNGLRLVRYIINKTNINKVINGGDTISQGERNAMMDDMITVIKGLEFPFFNHLLVAFGNHDSNKFNQTEQTSRHFDLNTCYSLMEKEAESYIKMMTDDDLSFYYDDEANKTRYIVLDMGEDMSSGNKVFTAYQEYADALLNTESGWKIVLAAHIITYGRGLYVRGIADAYNNRTTYTNENVGTFDFSSGAGKIEIIIGGHTHIDSIEYTASGIPVVVSDCDSYRTSSTDYPYVAGTDQEQCFDVVTVDYTNDIAKYVRIGRGVNRSVHIGMVSVSAGSTATVTPSVITASSWDSSDSSVATVASGTITGVASGSCIITASDTNGAIETWCIVVS